MTAKLDRLGVEANESCYRSAAPFNTEMWESLYPLSLPEQGESQNMGRSNRALAASSVDSYLDQKANLSLLDFS